MKHLGGLFGAIVSAGGVELRVQPALQKHPTPKGWVGTRLIHCVEPEKHDFRGLILLRRRRGK